MKITLHGRIKVMSATHFQDQFSNKHYDRQIVSAFSEIVAITATSPTTIAGTEFTSVYFKGGFHIVTTDDLVVIIRRQ